MNRLRSKQQVFGHWPLWLCVWLLGLGACASDARDDAEDSGQASGLPDAGPAGDSGMDADSGADPDSGVAACERETEALQAALDGAHDVNMTDVVLAVKTPECGLRSLSSGPSNVPPATLQRIASITKTYVSSLILELVADGLLSLSDPASQWFEDVPGGDAITVEHLLWHQSGLVSYEMTPMFDGLVFSKPEWAPAELIAMSFEEDLRFDPGTKWQYSNVNYVMLGVIAEEVTDQSLATLLRERIFEPLGLSATFSDGSEPLIGELAVGKNRSGQDVSNVFDSSVFWGAGHLVATPEDVVTWLEARGSGQFHDAETNLEFEKWIDWAPQRPGWRYGPGTIELAASATYGAGRGVGHGGDLTGYHSMAFYFPETDVTVVTVADFDSISPSVLRKPFYAALYTLFGGE